MFLGTIVALPRMEESMLCFVLLTWNMRTQALGGLGMLSNLKTSGLEIWYGVFEMHTSCGGKSSLIASPNNTSNFFCDGVPITRLVISLAIRGSNSTATSFFAFSRMRTLMLPVPGPISRTVSVGFRPAFSTIASAMPGFLRIC